MSDKVKASRRAFDREFKLQVVKEYHESGKNIAKTARKFEIFILIERILDVFSSLL